MTQNAFVFFWDENGIESIVPITEYEDWELDQSAAVLKGQKASSNPLNSILWTMKIRAQANGHRHYECYAVDCDSELDQQFWKQQWHDHPQETANLIRQRGLRLFGRGRGQPSKIV